MTPLMMEQLAIQQQIEALQQQQHQIQMTHQTYVNMGMIQPQPQIQANNFGPTGPQMPGMSPQSNTFQFPQQMMPQQMGGSMGASVHAPTHRRNQSALPNMGMGPPPAPSSGASGSSFGDYNQQNLENVNPRGGRGGSSSGGHARRHSLALPEAKKAAELAEQKRKTSAFQFPIPGAAGATSSSPSQPLSPSGTDSNLSAQSSTASRGGRAGGHGRSQSMAVGNGRGGTSTRGGGSFSFPAAPINETDFQRRGSSGHGRTGSRNFDSNWRQQNNGPTSIQEQQQTNMGNFQMNQSPPAFQPGHRARGSMNQSVSGFQFPNQTPLIQLPQGQVMMQQPQQMYNNQGLSQLQMAQLQALQTAQASGQSLPGMQLGQQMPSQMSSQQQAQQQRKTLFTPYLPQATLPALLSDGQLVAGTLRVNKKNRSDAYVTTNDLDADIFICGSKDRNRALEGDLVAIELLDVDEVWGQKREKEEKKKRKDTTDTRSNNTAANDATTGGDNGSTGEGGLRRRGSLRQRPTQKKNDDVEVEGQSLLLMEEEEINDEQKPLYAGHVVAVVERVAGQMFSGTLGLLRPSSQATKEKQDAERHARDGGNNRQNERQQDKPKIVWFKPTDKRVPLIAIPTEQAPRDFVEKHQDYANRIFVACIKRWPITSLHPFGTLVEQLGEMGDLKVETDALLRDNNFGPDEFSDAVIKSIGFNDWSVESDGEAALEGRRDFRSENAFTIDPNGAKELDDALHIKELDDGHVEIGMHVVDIAHFVKGNSLVDREAKKRGTGVYLMNRDVNMLPSRLSSDICCLNPGQDRYTVSVVFKVDPKSGKVSDADTWVGRSIIKSTGKLSYDDVDSVLSGQPASSIPKDRVQDVITLRDVGRRLRQARFGDRFEDVPALRLLHQLDDENIPVEQNIFDSSPAHDLIEEFSHRANAFVARKIYDTLGEKAWLRRQAPPNPRRLQTFAERMSRIGYEIDISSSGALQNSLFQVQDPALRMGMETLLVKAMQRAKYLVGGKLPSEELAHFALNLPIYTHFTNPSRRYADVIVHRQLEAVLSDGRIDFADDLDSLNKTAELCNTKKDSAQVAQEQSVHIESCRKIDRRRNEVGEDLICEGIVLCVYESAFDILIPEYGFEKRVHCDQLPLKKAEFDKNTRVLELYWEKGVPSSAYIPEDERSKPGSMRGPGSVAARRSEAARKQAEHEEARRRQLETGTISTDDADALFDDDDDASAMSEITESTAGVSLNNTDHDAQTGAAPSTSRSTEAPESKLTDKEKYLKFFTLRETGGNYIQDVTEMTRVPVILKTDLTKSPPCLTIRSLNPYAL
ncbi:MAG: hypothetical protein M1828_001773 [Chrysothrix sp. TS-e1954]|nr:MAG: hypothetical protein M1828_001773 [Chrysothrix sp. TS-e1954]